MRIYNSLSKQIEDFKPIEPDLVKMYCCGPTVYKDQQIGNWRTFCLSDFLHRALKLNGYKVDFIMNMTDVGHLFETGSDPEGGEDKIEQQSLEEGKSARDIVDMYISSDNVDGNYITTAGPLVKQELPKLEQLRLSKHVLIKMTTTLEMRGCRC